MRAANDALRFYVGRTYRIHTYDGDIITGRCAMVSSERVTLVSASGHFTTYTSGIVAVDNL